LLYFLRLNLGSTCSNVRNVRIVSCFCNGMGGVPGRRQAPLSRVGFFQTNMGSGLVPVGAALSLTLFLG
jgi:hypothetical protein